MDFQIEITETLQRVVTVKADTLSEAITLTINDYNNGEIVLDSMDFVGYQIEEYKE